jgi:hypothetical protein
MNVHPFFFFYHSILSFSVFPSLLKKLFSRFQQDNITSLRQEPGSGAGLYNGMRAVQNQQKGAG